MNKALLTKADFWAYEQEWRIIEHDKGPGAHIYPPSLLDGIILGARICPENRAKVLSWVSSRATKIEVLQARFHADLFRVEAIPV